MPRSPSAVEVPVKDIFSSNYLFNIPGYQRPYAWTQTQASELFDDLWGFLQANPEASDSDAKGQEEAQTYFLGSLVLIKEKEKPEAIVVDGQQRLTTLTLLFSALRASVSPEISSAIGEYIYEKGNPVSRLPDRFRLQLRPLDNPFFNEFVQREEGFGKLVELDSSDSRLDTDAKKNLRVNAIVLKEKLEDLSEEQRKDFAICIANRCYLVAVSTADFRSAFRIFSVLNSRGLDLGPTDILKARMLEDVSEKAPKRADDITRSWEAMEVELGRDGFFDLFTHIRAILRKTKAKGSLLDELSADLKGMKAADFVDQVLLPAKKAFAGIRDADYQHSAFGEPVNGNLAWLNRLDFKDWVPPAVAFWMAHWEDGERMHRFFADLERLAYSLLIRRENDNARISRFGDITKAIEANADLWATGSPLQLSPLEQWSTYQVLDGPFYLEVRSPAARKCVLLRLDSLLARGEASYDHPVISVEHVLPQTPQPDSEWMTWFPSPELRSHWTHRIGNLALLAKSVNSSARNFPFERKKNSYFKRQGVTTFALTVPVIEKAAWTPEIVKERQGELVSILERHWRLQERKAPDIVRL